MHANTEANAPVRYETGVRLGQGSLRLHRTLYRFHSTPKLSKNTIARRVRYAAPVFPDEPVEDRSSFGQAPERTDLVGTHEAAVALHICCEDCDELPADF